MPVKMCKTMFIWPSLDSPLARLLFLLTTMIAWQIKEILTWVTFCRNTEILHSMSFQFSQHPGDPRVSPFRCLQLSLRQMFSITSKFLFCRPLKWAALNCSKWFLTLKGTTRVTFVEIGNAQSVFYFNATYGNSPAVYVGARTTDSRPRTYHVVSDKPVLVSRFSSVTLSISSSDRCWSDLCGNQSQ